MTARPAAGAKAELLIVEDEADLVAIIRVRLKASGYDVRVAGTRAEGLAALAEKTPDVLILDILLPDGTGLDILESVRKNPALRNLPVIILSSFTSQDKVDAGYALGADCYLAKPYDPTKLVIAIDRLLSGQSARSLF